uniref:Uncharacterized protein LOC111100183 n=1 Tax=Crassostrea virginica TaxID=6565 RepID=A0A8B8AC92_CRAVI|nr:uncharacterized protein LOC111100183 [Crassostrea virginica]
MTYKSILRSSVLDILICMWGYVLEAEAATRYYSSYRSRRYSSSAYSMEPWMIVMIVLSALSIIAVPVVMILCIKCGCCKVVQKTNSNPVQQGMQMQAAPGQQFNPPPYASTTYHNSSSGNQFYHNGGQGFPPPQQNNYTSPIEAYNTDGKY